jgi:AraC-like DNA-binding protein
VREVAQGLWAQLQKETTALFHAKSSQVGILTNFSPSDFRIAPLAPAIVRAISRRQPCILLQRTNVRPVGKQLIDQFLGLDQTGDAASRCQLWAGVEGIFRLANQTKQDFNALRSAMLAGVEGLLAVGREPSHGGISAAIIQKALDLFLTTDFRRLLLLGLSTRQTFQQNRLASLLIIPEDRNPVSRVFTLAAREHGIPVYNYSYLFLSCYSRYKKPLADYVFVPSTYHADYFQKHFGLSPSQLICVGSHVIAARLHEARSLAPLACRQRVGRSPHRALLVFFSQPRLFEKSSTALSWLLAAAAQVDAEVAVRLHPGERHLASEYEQVINNKNISDRAWVDRSEASLTEALLAADIVATMWSNVGLEAAALDRAVLAIKIDKDPPIDLAGMGVAIGADSEESVGKIVSELLNGGAVASQLGYSRKHFFDHNPELLTGEVEEHIADAVCK